MVAKNGAAMGDAENDEGDAPEHEESPTRAQRGLHPAVQVIQIGTSGSYGKRLSSVFAPPTTPKG